MVDEAEERLTAYESSSTVSTPGNELVSIAAACLDGDKLHQDIRSLVGARDLNSFQRAVFSLVGPLSFQKGSGKNVQHHNALRVIKQAAQAIEERLRGQGGGTSAQSGGTSTISYVNPSRIAALHELDRPRLDPKRLICLLEELNKAAASDCYMATAMVVRAILDHVPTVYGYRTFAQVVANYGWPQSVKRSMDHLDKSLRNIADGHLHLPMRQAEDVPTFHQVDFRPALDQLLGDVTIALRSP